ncbi:MAG: hypothetical protein KDB60_09010 [Propionibacteriaceae bacterium]|nr:hypothetical protein [Propionibacteriaceae bacterium]HPE12001.1 hypothetical protein [Actinomycetota bacterium]
MNRHLWPAALGSEVMTVTEQPDVERLVREARDEDAAIADLEGCMRRLLRARDAKTALAGLPAEQLRAALHLRRTELEGNPT